MWTSPFQRDILVVKFAKKNPSANSIVNPCENWISANVAYFMHNWKPVFIATNVSSVYDNEKYTLLNVIVMPRKRKDYEKKNCAVFRKCVTFTSVPRRTPFGTYTSYNWLFSTSTNRWPSISNTMIMNHTLTCAMRDASFFFILILPTMRNDRVWANEHSSYCETFQCQLTIPFTWAFTLVNSIRICFVRFVRFISGRSTHISRPI